MRRLASARFMRSALLTVVLAGATLSFALPGAGGCRSPRRSEPFAGALPLAANDPQDQAALRGQAVFMQRCYQCHPAGEAGVGPGLNDKLLPGFAIRTQVRNGYGAMPGFSEREISGQDLDDLIEYLVALRHNKP